MKKQFEYKNGIAKRLDDNFVSIISKEDMYNEIRNLSQEIFKYQHIIRPMMSKRSQLLKKYFELDDSYE